MFIKFGLGESPDDQPFRVLDLSYTLGNNGGDQRLANCQPGEISMRLDLGVRDKPANEFLEFARGQLEVAQKKGAGMISIYQNEEAPRALQDITFSKAWITSFSQQTGQADDSVVVTVCFAPGEITVSDVKFEHTGRINAIDRR